MVVLTALLTVVLLAGTVAPGFAAGLPGRAQGRSAEAGPPLSPGPSASASGPAPSKSKEKPPPSKPPSSPPDLEEPGPSVSKPSPSTPSQPKPSKSTAGPTKPTPSTPASPSTPVIRPPVAPELSVPAKVEQGKVLVVSGKHFACGSGDGEGTKAGPLTLTGDIPAPIPGRTDASGTFSQPIKIPEKAPLGVYEVVATCDARPSVTAPASYEVVAAKVVQPPLPTPALTLARASGPPGTTVGVSGEGFLCRGPARLLWDGADLPGTGATPAADGKLSASFVVPAGAGAGTYKVTATCEAAPAGARATGTVPAVAAPASVEASQTFTVTQPVITPPPSGKYEITIHLTDYPAVCTWGRILVGGKGLLDPWLDADSYKGDAEPGHWRFIDLHAYIPPDMKGRQPVDLDCPERAVERAGTIDLPPEPFTAFFLPQGSPVEHHSEGSTGVLPRPTLPGFTPLLPTPSASGTPDPSPTSSDNVNGTPDPDPDPSPGPSEHPQKAKTGGGHDRPAGLVGSMRTPAEVSWALKDIAGSVGMAVWFLLLVLLLEKAFPSQLADNALSRWWHRRRAERDARAGATLPGWLRMGSFALLGGALVVWADATTHWSGPTVAKALGAAVGTLLILVTYEKTKDSLLRPGRGGVRAELRVVPAGLVLAVLMAALSRGLAFPVPYVYGLVAVYVVLGAVPPGSRNAMPKGQAVLVGGICVLSAALLVWVLGTPLIESGRTAPPGSLHQVLAYTVALMVVGGIEVVVFGMLPLSGMDGHALKSWSKPAWYALYLLALTLFFHVLLHSVHPGFGPGFVVSKDLRWCTLAIATALFAAAWVFSLGLRRHVARLERRAAAAVG
ncbi:FGLLP motif-containing membrane protein [Streptomyces sp. TLI_146]|uniref:FGLLP motif-containing membrane protein n=1 Tax=Streptomyces sp. TLI_146 TaxID=1938858 RepID=UPI00117BEFB4|nr:FGLLP motif-containing membrane protein [Streptomyces sp. TLI_146]